MIASQPDIKHFLHRSALRFSQDKNAQTTTEMIKQKTYALVSVWSRYVGHIRSRERDLAMDTKLRCLTVNVPTTRLRGGGVGRCLVEDVWYEYDSHCM